MQMFAQRQGGLPGQTASYIPRSSNHRPPSPHSHLPPLIPMGGTPQSPAASALPAASAMISLSRSAFPVSPSSPSPSSSRRSGSATRISLPPLPGPCSHVDLLSRLVTDPCRTFNFFPSQRLAREAALVEAVPREDAMLTFQGFGEYMLRPLTFPNLPIQHDDLLQRARAAILPATFGTIHASLQSIDVPKEKEQQQQNAGQQEETESKQVEEKKQEENEFTRLPFEPPIPTSQYSLFPISVQLKFKPSYTKSAPSALRTAFFTDLRLQGRAHLDGTLPAKVSQYARKPTQPLLNPWCHSLKGYRPLHMLGLSPEEYYQFTVLGSGKWVFQNRDEDLGKERAEWEEAAAPAAASAAASSSTSAPPPLSCSFPSPLPEQFLDPYFPCGLFGWTRNGLSLVMLSLHSIYLHSRSRGSPLLKRIARILMDHIMLVALQYWTIVHGRWAEKGEDEEEQEDGKRAFQPEYIFHFHHAVDFKHREPPRKRKRGKDQSDNQPESDCQAMEIDSESAPSSPATPKRETPPRPKRRRGTAPTPAPSVKQEVTGLPVITEESHHLDVDRLVDHASGPFLPFLCDVYQYVMQQMYTLQGMSDDVAPEAVRLACKDLLPHFQEDLPSSPTHSRSSRVYGHYQRLYTQFFTTHHFKLHPIRGLCDFIHHQLVPDQPHNVVQLMGESQVKFFPVNSQSSLTKMRTIKLTTEEVKEEDKVFINPYFWSHIMFQPNKPIVQTDISMLGHKGDIAHPVLDMAHQLCALRRLFFFCNQTDFTSLVELLQKDEREVDFHIQVPSVDKELDRHSTRVFEHTVKMSVCAFTESFLVAQTKNSENGLVMGQFHPARALRARPMLFPPAASPVALRYMEVVPPDDFAQPFVPLLSFDPPSLPSTDESSIHCMTALRWRKLYHLSRSDRHLVTPGYLLASGLLAKYPSDSAQQDLKQLQMASVYEVLRELGGFKSHINTLFPPDQPKDGQLYVYDGDKLRLEIEERVWLAYLIDPKHPPPPGRARARFCHLWHLLTKICKSESLAVASYVHIRMRLHDERLEEVKPLVGEQTLDRMLEELQLSQTSEEQCNFHSEAFRLWREQDPHLPYATARLPFLTRLDDRWNFCERPHVETEDLLQLFSGILLHALPQLQFTLQPKEDGEEVAVDTCFLPNSKDFHKLVSDLFSRQVEDMWQSRARYVVAFDSLVVSRLPVWQLPAHIPSLQSYKLTIQCPDGADSLLSRSFRHFMNGAAKMTSGRCGLQTLFIFFLWFMDAEFLAPLRRCLPCFYPDSSLVLHPYWGGAVGESSWLKSMRVVDGLPSLVRYVQTLVSQLGSERLEKELKVATLQKSMVTDHSKALLLAVKHLLRTYMNTLPGHVEHGYPPKLLAVECQIDNIIPESDGGSASLPYTVADRSPAALLAIQEQYKNCLIQCVKIGMPINKVLRRFYFELSKRVEAKTDPLEFILGTIKAMDTDKLSIGAWLAKHAPTERKKILPDIKEQLKNVILDKER